MALPRSGDVVRVGRAANVQFGGDRGIFFRVIRVHDWPCTIGWVWLDGYELNGAGDAIERRSIFVQPGGLRQVSTSPDVRARNAHRPRPPGGQAVSANQRTSPPRQRSLR